MWIQWSDLDYLQLQVISNPIDSLKLFPSSSRNVNEVGPVSCTKNNFYYNANSISSAKFAGGFDLYGTNRLYIY